MLSGGNIFNVDIEDGLDDMDDDMEEDEVEEDIVANRLQHRRQNRRIIIVWLDNDTRRMTKSKDPRPLYFGGEELSGTISIEIHGGKPIRQVKIMLINLIQIRWLLNQQQQRRRKSSTINTTTQEKRRKSIFADYFSSSTLPSVDEKQLFFNRYKVIEIDLLPSDKLLTDGKHEIPFRFQLPKFGPSSMKSCRGLIKYTVEAITIDDHNGHESRGEKEILLLIPNLDLLKEIERKITQTFITNDGNNVDITVLLDRKIYQPGEMITMKISMRNESDSNIECLVAIYQRHVIINNSNKMEQNYDKCLNDSPNRNDNDEFCQAVMIPINGNSQVKDETIQMRLPHNIVLTLNCSLMIIRYYVLITINIPDINNNNNSNDNILFNQQQQQSMEIPFLVSITSNQFGQRITPTQHNQVQRQISR